MVSLKRNKNKCAVSFLFYWQRTLPTFHLLDKRNRKKKTSLSLTTFTWYLICSIKKSLNKEIFKKPNQFGFVDEKQKQMYCFLIILLAANPPYIPSYDSGTCGGRFWTPFRGRCFAFFTRERYSFAHADFTCQEMGGAMVSIHDNATNAAVQTQVKARSSLPMWIGFKRTGTGIMNL